VVLREQRAHWLVATDGLGFSVMGTAPTPNADCHHAPQSRAAAGRRTGRRRDTPVCSAGAARFQVTLPSKVNLELPDGPRPSGCKRLHDSVYWYIGYEPSTRCVSPLSAPTPSCRLARACTSLTMVLNAGVARVYDCHSLLACSPVADMLMT